MKLHLVIGGRSASYNPAERARAAQLAARPNSRVTADVLPGAGHWVHVDDPEGLYALVTRDLPT